MAGKEEFYTELMSSQGIGVLATHEALERLGLLVDLAGDLSRDDGTERALAWAGELSQRSLAGSEAALLEYFIANAWSNKQRARHADVSVVWRWEQPELQRQLLHLRTAVRHEGFDELPQIRQCQIFTNLANQINTVGRFVGKRCSGGTFPRTC